ncbi:GNAT family N-acetyltransferase [Adlercreutzia sp. R7]|uniref:GNAT family N-acetyltransferase n=1 Tax=Adlercreutzia wanghongyangiae TaxID=3111451 RepID=A0ABU6IEW0_9ACTN|nr:GNAT family N-acetyltransferase [Adlercreutzia sp. R7]
MVEYKALQSEEINRELFNDFIRRQVVTKCWRKENGKWAIKDAPFVDDWTEGDYQILVSCLRNTVLSEGLVCAAFLDGKLKGFVSVEPEVFGGEQRYCDLSSIHVSEDVRGNGVGRTLFLAAKKWARERGAGKLYISAHSAAETQAFYKSMGCVEAEVYSQKHVEDEPFDCQLECVL